MEELVFDPKQQEAISRCVTINEDNRIVPINGQAGTGKTTIMKNVYHALVQAGYRVALCAPTGKAAKRITEATGIVAMTNHRLLEYPHPGERDPKTGKPLITTEPKRDATNPLEYDVVLGDEWAMVNWELHRNVVNALPRGGCIRLFGDLNQLPPIEKTKALQDQPSPFATMIQKFNGVTLDVIHRQSEGSGIIMNCDRILKGMIPRRTDDFMLKLTERPVEALVGYAEEMREEGFDFSTGKHQIITPTRKTWVGTAKLNVALQSLFRPEIDGWVTLPRHDWAPDKNTCVRVGDKVIWTENDYNIPWVADAKGEDSVRDSSGRPVAGIMNGETGYIEYIDEDTEEMIINFGDTTQNVRNLYGIDTQYCAVPPLMTYEGRNGIRQYDPRKSMDLGYAITTHKAQGSEWEHVVYVMNKSCSWMATQPNFYTGVSRAREHDCVISDQRTLSSAVWKKTAPLRRN